MTPKVGLLGGGSWGTTVASLIAKNAAVTLWARDQGTVSEINKLHTNEKYLPGATLPKDLVATTDLATALRGAEVIVVGVPSHGFRNALLAAREHIRSGVPIISLTKGLELDTSKRMTEIIGEVLPDHPVGVLSGPNLAREIISGQAASSVLAMPDESILQKLQPVFGSDFFRVYTNNDLIGCELGGILKNVIAIATGIADGSGAGENTRAALVTRGLSEITRLGVAMGGEAATFYGLAGMGDLVATCTSPQSRNYHVGFELGKGRAIDDIIDSMHMVAEGVKSCPAVMQLARKHSMEMPLSHGVYCVVHEGKTTQEAFRGILKRPSGSEAEPG